MSLPREFASDNTAPAHPAVLEALAAANHGPSHAYGGDPWTARAADWFREQFGPMHWEPAALLTTLVEQGKTLSQWHAERNGGVR